MVIVLPHMVDMLRLEDGFGDGMGMKCGVDQSRTLELTEAERTSGDSVFKVSGVIMSVEEM